jgi:hypothetical protein
MGAELNREIHKIRESYSIFLGPDYQDGQDSEISRATHPVNHVHPVKVFNPSPAESAASSCPPWKLNVES